MAARRDWVKIDVGLLNDARLNRVSYPAQCLWFRLYLALAREGGHVPTALMLETMAGPLAMPYRRAADSRDTITQAEVADMLVELWGADLLEETAAGFSVRGWEKYQWPLDRTSAARQRRSRQRRKDAAPAPTPIRAVKSEVPTEPEGGWPDVPFSDLVPRPK